MKRKIYQFAIAEGKKKGVKLVGAYDRYKTMQSALTRYRKSGREVYPVTLWYKRGVIS